MPGIFLSYRRSDTQDVAGRIFDRLVETFPREAVFKDVDSIPLSVSFPAYLQQALRSSDAMLVLIGPGWLNCRDESGQRRLDDPSDFVRIEVEIGLRLGIPMIPITVTHTPMPTSADLPVPLQPLVKRQGLAVRPDPDFHRDMNRLIRRLVPLVKVPAGPGVRFVTNRLENQEFLFSSLAWPFPTDPRGEDISSKHTARSERMQLATYRKFSSPFPTIAANELIIDFHLYNPTDTPRYLEMLYLAVEGIFPVTSTMVWNTWLPLIDPHRFEVELDPAREFYELGFNGSLIEISQKATEHVRLRIHGGLACTERIFRFRLGATSHDFGGTKEETASDRTYHIAFSQEHFAKHTKG